MSIKICPYCGEEIKAIAIKCRYCGSMLHDASATQKLQVTGITLVQNALALRYEIISEIGKGGMAIVYKSLQKNLKRMVALKVVHQNMVHDTEFLERFHREAQTAASLNHHNIVTVYDEGKQGSVHYMAMEYLEGTDLHKLIKEQGLLSVEQTIKYIAPIAKALHHAHNKGIIHRDIKSSNIIITKEGRPVLTDFGIAHAASGTKLTQTGTVIGTPEYMSPEQAEGKDVDYRSDLYSLGVVLFECLTGKVPFKGDNPLTTIHKIIYDPVTEPKLTNTNLPGWINTLVQSILEKDRMDRPQSGAELAKNLETRKQIILKSSKKLEEKKKTIRPVSKSIEQPKPKGKNNKNTLLKILAAIVFVIVIISGGIYLKNQQELKQIAIEQQIQENERIEKEEERKLEQQKIENDRIEREKQALLVKQRKEDEKKLEQQKIEKEKQALLVKQKKEDERIANEKSQVEYVRGEMYYKIKDYTKAAKWYRKAADKGNNLSKQALERLKKEGHI